jgi:two-component system, chemotaxis family, protein-glutamate methylesterase/glutaminase
MRNTGPEGTVPSATSGGGGAGLRPAGAAAGQRREGVYEVCVVGASWGGLPGQLELAFVVAQHRGTESRPGGLEELLQSRSRYPVLEAWDKDPIEPGRVYIAPPDYHLLVEPGSFALSVDARVNYARPSIDVLFESASDAYGERVIGIVLTGANEDGAAGLARIKARGGVAIVQDPSEAEAPVMPAAALAATQADAVLPLAEIGRFVHGLCLDPATDRSVTAR